MVARLRGTLQKVWNVDLRLVLTFDALFKICGKPPYTSTARTLRQRAYCIKVWPMSWLTSMDLSPDLEATILHEIKGTSVSVACMDRGSRCS